MLSASHIGHIDSQTYRLIRATDSDEARIRNFLQKQRVVLSHLQLTSDIDTDLSAIEAHYNNRGGFILLVEDIRGELVATLGALPTGEYTWEIRKCYAAPSLRGEKWSERLMAEALRAARAAGVQALVIQIHPSLFNAIRFYQHFGFSRLRERKAVSIPGSVWLVRDLKIQGVKA